MIRKNINEYLIVKDNKVVVDIYNSIEQIGTETVSGDFDTLTIANGSITLKDVNGNVINTVPTPATATIEEIIPDGKVTLNGNAFLSISPAEIENITLKDQDGNDLNFTVDGNDLVVSNDLFWTLNFNGTTDVITLLATVGNVGTFASESGTNVGTITVSTDGVTYGALTFPFTPISGTTYYFKRSTATVNGVFNLIGTY